MSFNTAVDSAKCSDGSRDSHNPFHLEDLETPHDALHRLSSGRKNLSLITSTCGKNGRKIVLQDV